MMHINRIRNHINKKENKGRILSFLSLIMIILSLILGGMIYMKKDENGKFLSENFGISVNFKTFNNKVNSLVNSLFKFEFENKKNNDQLVSNRVMYIPLENNMFTSEDTSVSMLHDGVILGVYQENESYSLLVSYNNGVVASYSALNEVIVKQYDELNKGEKFASYQDSFKVLFKKEGKLISYNEAII